MDFNLYHAEDFAADESFNAYYLKTDEQAVDFWTNWISLHPEKLDEVYNAEQILATLNLRLKDEELHTAFARFDDFLQSEAEAEEFYQQQQPTFFTVKKLVAAGALVVLAAIGVFYLKQEPAQKQPVYASYYNGFGKTTQLTLADGTLVTLNANSTLKYPKSFAANKREVTLSGEAFFEVTKDKKRPFSVQANGTKTTVLGTKFNISAYLGSDNTKIALVEGMVLAEANAGKDKLTLKPSEMAVFSEKDKKLSRNNFDAAEITGWKSGILIFNQASFEEIATKFKNVYGITLLNQAKNTQWSFSAHFDKTDYLTVIKSICFSKKLKYTHNDNTIVITQ